MGMCKHCNKWIIQPEGRRKKEFCNNTCRSNYWYGKNKKGKDKELDTEIKYVVPTSAAYDSPKMSDIIHDEPPQWVEPKKPVVIPKTAAQWMKEKRDIENPDDYQTWLAALEADPYLGKKQKDLIKSTNPSEL